MKMVSDNITKVSFSFFVVVALVACSTGMTEYSGADSSVIRAVRISGTTDGRFDASEKMINAADSIAEAENGSSVATSGSTVPPKAGVQSDRESNQDRVDSALIGACLDKIKVQNKFSSFKVVDINGTNKNNRVIYEDPVGSEPSLLLLRIALKNVNNSSIKMLNPKSTYCIDMQVKNMNKFNFQIACESKVGFVRLSKKNANKMSTDVSSVQCE